MKKKVFEISSKNVHHGKWRLKTMNFLVGIVSTNDGITDTNVALLWTEYHDHYILTNENWGIINFT